MKKIITITSFVLVIMSSVFSQTNEVGKKYVYEFRDGTTIIGTFIKDEAGNIYINRNMVGAVVGAGVGAAGKVLVIVKSPQYGFKLFKVIVLV